MRKFIFRIYRRTRRRTRRNNSSSRRSYLVARESARTLVTERLAYFRAEYLRQDPTLAIALTHRRLAIRNQRSRWGSCSSKKNLNFNYRILELSPEMRDYVIVHELCHLKELNHGKSFWGMVKRMIPNARELHRRARKMKIT